MQTFLEPTVWDCPSHSVHLPDFQDAILNKGYAGVRYLGHHPDNFMAFSESLGHDFVIRGKGSGFERIVGGNSGRFSPEDYPGMFLETGPEQLHAVPLHGELYFHHPIPPQLLWCYCHRENVQGGGRLQLCDGVQLYQNLPVAIQDFLRLNPLVYKRVHASAVWQTLYQTHDFEELKQAFEARGIRADLSSQGYLSTAFQAPALQAYAGQWACVNNLLSFGLRQIYSPEQTSARVCLESGEDFPKEIILKIWDQAQTLSEWWPWQVGDFLVIDNTRYLHGREALLLPGREIFVRMSRAHFLDTRAPRALHLCS